MLLLLLGLAHAANPDPADLSVHFLVWAWSSPDKTDARAHDKLIQAAEAAGYRSVKDEKSSRWCGLLSCQVTATARAVR